jgi:hypothetical protein
VDATINAHLKQHLPPSDHGIGSSMTAPCTRKYFTGRSPRGVYNKNCHPSSGIALFGDTREFLNSPQHECVAACRAWVYLMTAPTRWYGNKHTVGVECERYGGTTTTQAKVNACTIMQCIFGAQIGSRHPGETNSLDCDRVKG